MEKNVLVMSLLCLVTFYMLAASIVELLILALAATLALTLDINKPLVGCQTSVDNVVRGTTLPTEPPSNEIDLRIDSIANSVILNIPKKEGCGGLILHYGIISHKGFYPDDANKPNQDAYVVKTVVAGSAQRTLFMVFDGHGKEGHTCALFCKEYLPEMLEENLLKLCRNDLDGQHLIEAAIYQSFLSCNNAIHNCTQVDDTLSGTTAVGILIDGHDMYIANVGDSRAVVVQEHEGKLIARPLSCDQTPYRRDERERVKSCGARVLSMDQLEGIKPFHENWGEIKLGEELDEGGDPPRIWSPYGEYPGTAFTRSMGDEIAEDLGVIAEPEVIRRRISSTDKYVIIASDGVFEFLTNQQVADMISKFSDPQEACKKVVVEAYNLWLQYEVRTDDITIIIISIDGIMPISEASGHRTSTSDLDALALEVNRPVRREMTRERRRQLIHYHSMDSPSDVHRKIHDKSLSLDASYCVNDHVIKKNSSERASIEAALQANFLFDNVTQVQHDILLDAFQNMKVSAGDYVIKEGDRGNCFYIIDTGVFEVRVLSGGVDKKTEDEDHPAGSRVHVYKPSDEIKPCFGHLALLYSCPRSASVIACTNGSLWVLDGSVFQRINGKSRREIAQVLRRVNILQSLSLQQLSILCDAFTEEEYEPGDFIIKQGEVGDTFFVLEDGTARVTMNADDLNSPPREIRNIHPYEYFGERALLLSEPRSANVIADSRVRCLALSKKVFEQLLGPLQRVIDVDQRRRAKRIVPHFREITLFNRVPAPYMDEIGRINLCKIGSKNEFCTMMTFSKAALISNRGLKAALERGLEISQLVTDTVISHRSYCLAPFIAAYNESTLVHCVMRVEVVCSLSALQDELERRRKGRGFTLDAVQHCSACILLGLEAVHESNVLFRGVTPDMIMLDRWGNSVLTDYRLSKLGTDSATTLCGAPEYLAPEQVRRAIYDKGVDFWMLGILIYELLHGRTPFEAETEMNTYANIVSHTSRGLDYPTSFEPALCDLLDRLICPDPKQRNHQWFAGLNWEGIGHGGPTNHGLYEFAIRKMNELTQSRSRSRSSSNHDSTTTISSPKESLGDRFRLGDSVLPENGWMMWD